MSKSTDTTNPRCGGCVQMREDDGYCPRLGRYVNYFRKACKDYVDRNAPDTVKAEAPKEKPTTRTCKQCGRELPLEQFTRSCKSRDGYTHTCKECRKAEGRAVYERNCARKGITPKPPRVDVPGEVIGTLISFSEAQLVAELRRRGWTITATKEL